MKRRRFHQVTLGLAGLYNIGWGLFSAMRPNWLFEFAEMEPMRYPEIFACLAMVVGLYGVLYLAAAARPERGGLIVAVGLAGKILGPIGLANLVFSETWPIETLVLCLTNDLIWWPFFGLFMADWYQFHRQKRDTVKV